MTVPSSRTEQQVVPTLHFHMDSHERGSTWGKVTEGNDKSWENARHEWAPSHNRGTVTTHDSTSG